MHCWLYPIISNFLAVISPIISMKSSYIPWISSPQQVPKNIPRVWCLSPSGHSLITFVSWPLAAPGTLLRLPETLGPWRLWTSLPHAASDELLEAEWTTPFRRVFSTGFFGCFKMLSEKRMAWPWPGYPLVNCPITMERSTMFFMGKLTISMAIFNSYFDITRGYMSDHVRDDPLSIWKGMDDFNIPHNGVCYGASELFKRDKRAKLRWVLGHGGIRFSKFSEDSFYFPSINYINIIYIYIYIFDALNGTYSWHILDISCVRSSF